MSCVAAIQVPQTKEQIRLAQEQRLKYSSPAPRASLAVRLVKMSKSSDAKVRERAALDSRILTKEQRTLARDPDAGVRRCMARNPMARVIVLSRLALDPDATVRAFVATNPACPAFVLIRLASDDDERVATIAANMIRLALLDEENRAR